MTSTDARDLASCGHPRNEDGECNCAWWPERAPYSDTQPDPYIDAMAAEHVSEYEPELAGAAVPWETLTDQHRGAANISYLATFDRISRDHNVTPLLVTSAYTSDVDDIAERIYNYAKSRVASRDVEVAVDLEKLSGTIFCGMHVGGSFTLDPSGDCLACGKPVQWSTAYDQPHWVHVSTADILACGTTR